MNRVSAMLRRLRTFWQGEGRVELGGQLAANWYDAHYSVNQKEYSCHYAQSRYYFLWTVIADRVRRAGFSRILEIGCGAGQLASFLLDQGVKQYVGLDFSATAIAIAQQNAPAARFEVGDARTSGLYSRVNYEALICTEILEHVPEDLLIVSRFVAGKRCICSVPNFPYQSHVRHFRNASQVVARYGAYFQALDVMTFKSPHFEADEFFLFDGIRNSHMPTSSSGFDGPVDASQESS